MDVSPADASFSPALRDALDRAAAGTSTVRVASAHGDYSLVAQELMPAGDQRPSGPACLGTMARLGRDLSDLD